MDTNDLAVRRPSERGGESFELDRRQRSWLLLVGVPLAIAGAMLAVAAMPDHMVAGVLGIGLFLAGTVTALTFTGYVPRASRFDARPNDRANSHGRAKADSERATIRDSMSSMQLGPDPVQVIGRQTGARI